VNLLATKNLKSLISSFEISEGQGKYFQKSLPNNEKLTKNDKKLRKIMKNDKKFDFFLQNYPQTVFVCSDG
jgi:hypothetical protein